MRSPALYWVRNVVVGNTMEVQEFVKSALTSTQKTWRLPKPLALVSDSSLSSRLTKSSMLKIQTTFSLLLCVFSVWPGIQSLAAQDSSGRMFYVSQSYIELGRLAPDEKRSFSIQIGNKGSDTLTIYSVSTTCGCLSPAEKWKDVELQPGESKQVQFYLLAEQQSRGRMTKTIMFKTSDPQRKHSPVIVSYAVKPEYRLAALPAKLDFGQVEPETPAVLKLTLVSPYPDPLQVNSIECSDCSILIRPVRPNGRPDVVAYLVELPEGFQPGPISESIEIDTAVGKIVVPINGYKMGIIECTPSDIIFQPVRFGVSAEASLVVRSTHEKEFRVIRAITETEQIQVKVEAGQQSRTTHKLRLQFMPNKEVEGVGRSCILVVTDKFGSRAVNCSYFVHR